MEVAIVFRPFSSPGWSLSLIIIAFKVVAGKASGQGASIQQPWYKTQCSRAVKEGYFIPFGTFWNYVALPFKKDFKGHMVNILLEFSLVGWCENFIEFTETPIVGTKKRMVSCRFFLHSMEDLFDIINSERRRDEQRAEAKVWRVRWR
jgi:hypothetical protein